MSSKLTKLLIWGLILCAGFAYAWWKGYVRQLSDYVKLTREELRKCTWPTWDELKGSTLVVTISIVMLGVFTYAVDTAFFYIVRLIS